MQSLNLTSRIALAFVSLLAVMVVLVSLSFRNINQVSNQFDHFAGSNVPGVVALYELNIQLLGMAKLLSGFRGLSTVQDMQREIERYDSLKQQTEKQLILLGDKGIENEDFQQALSEASNLTKEFDKKVTPLFGSAQRLLEKKEKLINVQNNIIKLDVPLKQLVKDFKNKVGFVYAFDILSDHQKLIKNTDQVLKLGYSVILQLQSSGSLNPNSVKSIKAALSSIDSSQKALEEILEQPRTEGAMAPMAAGLKQLTLLLSADGGVLDLGETIAADQSQLSKLVTGLDTLILKTQLFRDLTANAYSSTLSNAMAIKASTSQQARTRLTLVVGFAFTVAIVVYVLLFKSIKQPLSHLLSVLGGVSEGDVTRKAQINRNDEFGLLGDYVDQSVASIRALLQELTQAADILTSQAEVSNSVSSKLTLAIDEQQGKTVMVATAVEQMSCSIKEIATGAETIRGHAHNNLLRCESSNKVVENNQQTISQLVERMRTMENSAEELRITCDSIGKVLAVIENIAEKTNILALNAAIEAARAGEQGRGFAVVAEEVRSLAAQTRDSTNDISDMLKALQEKSNAVLQNADGCIDQVDICAEQANECAQALLDIKRLTGEMEDSILLIATATEQQSSVAEEVSSNTQAIAMLSDTLMAQSKESSDGGARLQDMAKAQQELVSRYRT